MFRLCFISRAPVPSRTVVRRAIRAPAFERLCRPRREIDDPPAAAITGNTASRNRGEPAVIPPR